jgi:hypothetical protein
VRGSCNERMRLWKGCTYFVRKVTFSSRRIIRCDSKIVRVSCCKSCKSIGSAIAHIYESLIRPAGPSIIQVIPCKIRCRRSIGMALWSNPSEADLPSTLPIGCSISCRMVIVFSTTPNEHYHNPETGSYIQPQVLSWLPVETQEFHSRLREGF